MRICIECRLLLEEGETCGPGHLVVGLEDPRLVEAVWGSGRPGLLVRRERPSDVGDVLKAGAGLSLLGIGVTIVATAPFSMCTDHPIDTLGSANFWITVGVVSAIVVPALIVEQLSGERPTWRELALWMWPWRRPRPRGAGRFEPPGGLPAAPGRVVGEPTLTAPSGRPCVAWTAAVERDGQVFLRAARAGAFRVALDNGGTVDVAAGPIDLHAAKPRELDATRWLATLPRPSGGSRDPFPARRGWEATLAPGDAVEVLGELDGVVDPDAGASAYREPAAELLRPRGRAVLRN